MVAIITGKGTGLERGSAFVLGSQGQFGSAALGRDGESVFVNAANGNLLVTRQDEFLIGLGPDVSIGRTYNSQSTISDGDNGDNWRASVYRKIQDLSGTYGAAATSVKRIDWDGSETLFTWNAGESAYVATDGAGAYDKLTRSGDIWTWTDGNSRVTELYDQTRNGLITTTTDADGNSLTYTYNSGSGLITRVTSLNGGGTDEYVDLTYDGTKLTQLLTTKSDGTLTRVRYTYDGSNRLSTVTVDLSPNDSAVTDGNKYVTTYTYHSTSTRVASIAQSDGSLLEISYVLDGSVYRVSSYAQTIAAGVVRTTSFDYSVAGQTTVTDPAGLKTVFHHDANGNLVAIAYPPDPTAAARLVQFAYNANGDVVSATHGPGNVVSYGYDSRGNVVTERDSAGNLVWRTYGAKNELLTESRTLDWSPSVPTSSFETPSVGTGWETNPTISGTTFTNQAGITGNGSAFSFAAAPEGTQVAFIQSGVGLTGAISETISGLKAGTRYIVSFSIAARPVYGGNPITVAFDGTTLGTFMPSSTNFETIIVGFVASGATGTLSFTGGTSTPYIASAIDSVKVAEVQTSWYAYDSENHLRYALDGEGGVTQYSYHAAGLLASTIELAGHTYTESGLRPGKPIVDTVLDSWASGLSDKSSARRTDRSYDFRGGLDKVTSYAKLTSAGAFDTGSDKSETTYVYDQAGNLLSRVSNVSSAAETFVYDGLGRMTMATDFNANVTCTYFMDTLGQTVVTHANGLSETSTYNRGGELISFARSEAGANLVDLSAWPGNPASFPSGQATQASWLNPGSLTDETQWASTMGPDGVPIVAMQTGQTDASAEGGGNFTNYMTIDGSKSYEFTYYFKLSALDKHAVYFGLSQGAYVENAANGVDDGNPYFYYAWLSGQGATYSADKWYKVVGYVLPQGAAAPSTPLGGVYDVATGEKVANIHNTFRWNAERPNDVIYGRFFNYYGEANQQYSTYFDRPEIRQVTAPAAIDPNAETSQYRYDNLGRLRMTIDPTGRRQHMMYDSAGRKIADIDADGSVIEYRYDGSDNLTSTTRYANKLSSGQLASLIDGNGNPTSAALSTLRPSSHADDSWTFQVYDRAQRLVQTIDGTGATTVFTYDGASQLVSTKSYANKIGSTTLANLKAAAATPNLWNLATNGSPASSYNLSFTAAGTIDGVNAFQATIGAGTDWQAIHTTGIYVEAGQTLTATITVKAVGSVTSERVGLYGNLSAWGLPADASGLIVSGPGTITQWSGGYFSVEGLSTTQATRFTISRTYQASEWASPYFYLGDGAVVPGRSTIVSAPVYTSESPNSILPTADAANDRTTRTFYDKDGRVVGSLDGAGGLTRFVYDKAGRKVTELGAAKAANSSLWATGTLAELVTSVGTASSDRRVDYVYDARGFLRFTVDANARPIETVYDAAGRAIRTISYAGSIASASSYSLAYVAAQLSSTGLATNAANRITRTVYDAAGQAMFGIDATDAVTAFTYDGVGKVTKQIAYEQAYALPGDPSLATMQSWATSQASNALNRISRNVYDLMGRVAYQVDAENYVTENRYDRAGRVLKSIRYAGTYTVADGATKESVATLIGAPSGAVTTTYAYDADGLLSQTTDGTGAVTRFAYDALGRLTDTTVAYGTADASITHRAYDVLGRATSEIRAYGTGIAATTAFEYDSLGNLTKTTDALGHHTMRTYDRLGRVLSVSVPVDATPSNNLVTSYQYDAFGNVGVVTDARGSSTFTYYDALGRSTLLSDAEGYITQTSYTIFGEVYQVTRRALRGTGTPTLTAPPTIVTNADDATTTFEYDKNGRRLRATDALGYYDYTYRTTFGEGWLFLNKLGGVTAGYNDRLGREYLNYVQGQIHNPDGTVESTGFYPHELHYDSRGNVVIKYEAPYSGDQRMTSYVYDDANRLIQIIHPSVEVVGADLVTTSTVSPTETFTYNARGELILAVDASGGKTHHYYDALGRKSWEVSAVGTLSQWTYDANGNVVSLKVYGDAVAIPTSPGGAPPTAPSSYRETLYEYDWAGRLKKTSVGTLLTGEYSGAAYATASAEVATTTLFYRDTGVSRETDARGNFTWTWHDRLGRELARVDRDNYLTVWTRDANGNALSETRYATRITGSFSDATTVAGLQTLAGTNAADRATNFTYDLNGRRLTETRIGVVAWTVSGTGALSAAATSATITYTYNGLGQVTSRTEANGDLTTYVYDAVGRLTRTKGAAFINNGGTNIRLQTDFFYDALGNVVRIAQDGDATDDASARITMSTYGAGGRLAKTTDAAGFERNFQYDAAGRVVKEWYDRTKADGTTIVREAIGYRYDLAGRLVTQAAATWNGSAWSFGDATRTAYNAYGEVSGKGLTAGPNDTAVYQEQFFYDEGGRLWKSTAGDGAVKLMYYDKGGNLSLTLSSAGADLSGYTAASAAATLTGTGDTTIANAVTTILAFDKRGLQVQSREPDRQLGWNGASFDTAELVRNRVYNAFGEVLSESDPRNSGWLTEYAYNAMGRLIEKKSPSVSWTSESGAVASARPTETYYYDLSGRLVGVRDANNNLTTRKLENGTGHDGGEALVNVEYHADGGNETVWHNVFGDARVLVDALGQWEVRGYDAMGRVNEVIHRGSLISDYYLYDGLGRRIRHWNSQFGSSVVERTDYDRQGRVSQQIQLGGDTTTYAYAWNGSLSTALGTHGGWVKTTTNASSLSATETLDYFGRTIARTDYGSHSYTMTFDLGGRLTAQAGPSGQSMAHSWLNTNLLYRTVDTAGTGKNVITANFAYDAAGNRTYEGYAGTVYSFYFPSGTSSATQTLQNATIAYDALGRVTSFTDKDAGGTTRITVANEYDLAGNVRRINASYPLLIYSGNVTSNKYYRYDAMNRMVVADGVLSGGTIVRGSIGADIAYDATGRRVSQTRDALLNGQAWTWYWYEGHGPPYELPSPLENGDYHQVDVQYIGARREQYEYRADGSLANVKFAETGYDDNGDGTVTANGTYSTATLRAEYTRDGMERITRYREFAADGATVTHDRYDISYDNRNSITAETVVQKKTESGGVNTYKTITANSYTNGNLVSTTADTYKNNSDSALPDTSMSYSYVWYDGARIGTTTYDKDTGSSNTLWDSTYAYDGIGRIASVDIDDGRRRTVSFAYTPEGQILRRKERSAVTNNPEDQRYFVAGRQVGDITTDGNNDPAMADYAQNINNLRNWTPSPQSAPYRWNTTSGYTIGTFGPSAGYEYINPFGQGSQSTGSSYTARDGETLQSIATSVWGDASLWYLLAEANGMAAGSTLIAGQNIILPDRVTNAHNNSSVFKVYDPNAALGDLSPTSAKPPKKPGACAIVGQIIMVAIAVGVTILTSGAAASLGPVLAGAIGGAAGSVASQAFGVATGLQSKFDWKGVAMGAIGGAVGGGLSSIKGAAGAFLNADKLVSNVVRGALSSSITQGIGVATGLQDKFSWVGVATAGVIGGVSGAVTRALTPAGSPLAHEMGHSIRAGTSSASFAALQAGSAAGALAGAAFRSLATGTSFGDNLIAVLPDVIGSTIGNMFAQGVQARGSGGAGQEDEGPGAYEGDGMLAEWEDSDSYLSAAFAWDAASSASDPADLNYTKEKPSFNTKVSVEVSAPSASKQQQQRIPLNLGPLPEINGLDPRWDLTVSDPTGTFDEVVDRVVQEITNNERSINWRNSEFSATILSVDGNQHEIYGGKIFTDGSQRGVNHTIRAENEPIRDLMKRVRADIHNHTRTPDHIYNLEARFPGTDDWEFLEQRFARQNLTVPPDYQLIIIDYAGDARGFRYGDRNLYLRPDGSRITNQALLPPVISTRRPRSR